MKGYVYLKNNKLNKVTPSFRFENKEHRINIISELTFKYNVKSKKEFLHIILDEQEQQLSGEIKFYSKNKLYKKFRYESAAKRQKLIRSWTKNIKNCHYVICPDFQ
jgi:hypothetical protein